MERLSHKLTNWLYAGAIIILIQVSLGGITRLSDAGLSMTQWNIVKGSKPPMNATEWEDAFDRYKTIPQFKALHEDMTLNGFKEIYFWEYTHRMWGRLVFAFFFFLFAIAAIRKKLPKGFFLHGVLLTLLIAAQGVLGWIMVKSGLSENIYVSHYRLTAHLVLALVAFCYNMWLIYKLKYSPSPNKKLNSLVWVTTAIAFVQLIYGGFMAGTKAAGFYPSWPLMNGKYVPSNLFSMSNWFANFFDNVNMIQFIHRNVAIVLFVMAIYTGVKAMKANQKISGILLHAIIFFQFMLGIITVMMAQPDVPVLWGLLHQLGGFVLFAVLTRLVYVSSSSSLAAN